MKSKSKTASKKARKPIVPPVIPPIEGPKTLHIVTAGLFNGKWGIVLSNGMELEGVEEIVQTKPSYSDGYTVTAKIFIPFKSPKPTDPLTPINK